MDKQIVLKNGDLEATISLLGAQLISFKRKNKEYIWTGDATYWKGHAPILFPICGGLINGKYYLNGKSYEMTKHGFIRFQIFEAVALSESKVILKFKDNETTYSSFPFHFTFFVIYELKDQLNIEYIIKNESEENMYFNVGSHEGYLLEEAFSNYNVVFDKEEKLEATILEGPLLTHQKIDLSEFGNHMPLRYSDYEVDALVFEKLNSRKASLVSKSTGTVLTIEFPDAKSVVLWSIPKAKFICIEPWNGIHDYVDSKLDIKKKKNVTILSKDKVYTFSHSIKVR